MPTIATTIIVVVFGVCSIATASRAEPSNSCKQCREQQQACAKNYSVKTCKISCTCRIQSYRSSRNNFWRRLVAVPDTACNCWIVQLVMQ